MPILHLGRPLYFYWLAPYPNTMALWPQWRSALVWDFWAILSYLLFSIVFWYVGLIPDLATMRDRARTPRAPAALRRVRARLARLGPRTGERCRRSHHDGRARPFRWSVSVHSIVGLDFAASLMPGWHESIFPPYFVVGAMYSGFAMVVVLAALCAGASACRRSITREHFDVMGKVCWRRRSSWAIPMRPNGSCAWYGGKRTERSLVAFDFTGTYAPLYLGAAVCNVAIPQALWFRAVRRSLPAVVRDRDRHQYRHVAGADLDRLDHALARLHAVARGEPFIPTFWDWSLSVCAARAFRLPVPDLRSPGARGIHVRHARTRAWEGAA